MSGLPDYYEVLGIARDASPEEIKQRYRFLAQAYHPDRFGSDAHKEQAEEEFKRINEAYEVLSRTDRRTAYDSQRRQTEQADRTDGRAPHRPEHPRAMPPEMHWDTVRRMLATFSILVAVIVYAWMELFPRPNSKVVTTQAVETSTAPATPPTSTPIGDTSAGSVPVKSAISHGVAQSPNFDEIRTFRFFATAGRSTIYEDGSATRLTEDKESFRNGELTFMITGESEGRLIGNLGSSDVAVRRSKSSVAFVERTIVGTENTLVVTSEWNPVLFGFRAIYTRNVWKVPPFVASASRIPSVRILSQFEGFVRPHD